MKASFFKRFILVLVSLLLSCQQNEQAPTHNHLVQGQHTQFDHIAVNPSNAQLSNTAQDSVDLNQASVLSATELTLLPPSSPLTLLPTPSLDQPLPLQEAISELHEQRRQEQALLENQQGTDSQEFMPVQRQELRTMEEAHQVALIPSPPAAIERVLKRDRKRVNIDQLEASILSVLEGIQWTERRGNQTVNLFVALADTLGKPDFIQDTYEDLAPTSLFHKFLDDMARFTCSARITADMNVTPAVLWGDLDPANGFISDRTNIEERIKFLVFKFHQRKITNERELAYWSWIFQSGEFVSQNPYGGWLGLCVALIIHPDFYSY